MKDYFAAIIPPELLGVTRGVIHRKPMEENFDKAVALASDLSNMGDDREDKNLMVLSSVTPVKTKEILLEARKTKAVPLSPLIPIDKDLFTYFYNERCGILQFDGNLTQWEAELRAYQETLENFIGCNYPNIGAIFDQSILNLTFP